MSLHQTIYQKIAFAMRPLSTPPMTGERVRFKRNNPPKHQLTSANRWEAMRPRQAFRNPVTLLGEGNGGVNDIGALPDKETAVILVVGADAVQEGIPEHAHAPTK